MPYFLYDGILEVGQSTDFSGEEARHALQVRRLHCGEHLILQDSNQRRFQVSLLEKQRNSAKVFVQKEVIPPQESPLQLEIMIALCKEKALNFTLQKLTELGVSRIIVFHSQRSQVNLHLKLLSKWQRIALEACKQSERWQPPQIHEFSSLAIALESCSPCQKQWVLDPHQQQTFNSSESYSSCRIIIGAEGGLAYDELAICHEYHYQAIRCGPRILRSETAAIGVASYLQFLYGDFNIL